MKRKLLSVALAAVMLCGLLPTSAFAAPTIAYVTEEDSMALTTVSYTIGANYEIIIPSSINLNEGKNLSISATTMNIEYGKSVCVYINGNNTFENGGNFYLRDGAKKISCAIRTPTTAVNGLDYLVARFDDGSLTNAVTDPISFEPDIGEPGTYTGTIYFSIAME